VFLFLLGIAGGLALAAEEAPAPQRPANLELMIQRHQALHDWIAKERQRIYLSGGEAAPGLGILVPPRTKDTAPPPAPPGSDADPLPLPGGLIPGVAQLWIPGPVDFGFQGTDVDPNTITNFQGFAAMAYLAGVTVGSDGVTYEQFHDMRLFQGNYVTADGTHHRGTFVFI
jgi:hypothetical protein